jgi:hypothetical protein
MIAWASGFGMGVGSLSRQLRGVGVLAMLDAGLDTTRPVESDFMVPRGASVLRQLLPGMLGGLIIDCRCVADGVGIRC